MKYYIYLGTNSHYMHAVPGRERRKSGNQGMEVRVALLTVTLSDPPGEFVLPVLAPLYLMGWFL